ncbi:MAG: rRNA pseudouridine synthase [Ktedonobacteraceae bacterium]|nr:rRNA pseudouridine synthase [Ktedonobacteraceae bacterium]
MSEKESEENKEHEPGERLARFLAHAGVASRRHAEELIAAGRVRVNNTVVTTQGVRIDPAHDHISVDGKSVQAVVRHVYLLLNKPAGYVSTAYDPQGRPTVLNLLPPDVQRLRVYPVGRLDIDTEGLLLLTNDGDFALHLTHPRYTTDKHYEALVQGYPSSATLAALRAGVAFTEDDGVQHKSSPAQVRVLRRVGSDAWLSLTIHEGRKRQIRRMLAAVGYPVRRLLRVGVGSLTLGNLPVGKWRYLTEEEVGMLWNKKE